MRNRQHDLIKTGDPDSFEQIQDRNGEVALAYCRRCKEAEAGLKPQCPGKPSNPFNKLFLVYRPSGRYFPAFWALMWGTGVAGGVHISGRNIGATQAKPTKRQQRHMLKEWKKSLYEFGDTLSRAPADPDRDGWDRSNEGDELAPCREAVHREDAETSATMSNLI